MKLKKISKIGTDEKLIHPEHKPMSDEEMAKELSRLIGPVLRELSKRDQS